MALRLATDSRTTPLPLERGPRRRQLFGLMLALASLVAALGGLQTGPPARAATTYTVTRSVAVGADPTGVAVDIGNGQQFVQNAIPAGDGIAAITVVDDVTGAVTSTFPTAQLPVDLALDSAAGNLYVLERRNGAPPPLSTFGPSGTLTTGPIVVAQFGELYGGRIEVFDATTRELQGIFQLVGYLPTAMARDNPRNIAIVAQTPDTATGFSGPPGVVLADFNFNEIVRQFETPGPPTSVAFDQSTGMIYVTSTHPLSTELLPLPGTLTVINTLVEPPTVVPVTVGADPGDVALDAGARRAYVANRGAGGTVSVVNLDTNQVVRTVNVSGARQVAVDPIGDVYLTGNTQNNVSVLRIGDLALLATVAVAGTPDGVAVDPISHRAFVTAASGSRLVTISRQTTTPPAPATTIAPLPATTFPPPVTTATVVPTVAPTTRAPTTTALPPPTTAPTTTLAAVPPAPPPPPPPPPATTIPRSEKAAAQFVEAVPSPLETRTELGELAQDAFLTIVFLALLSLPINVVNGIAETNAEQLAARTAGIGQRLRARTAGDWIGNLPVGLVLVVAALVSAVLYGFLQPSFGLDEPSLALVVGVTLAVLLLNAVQRLSQIAWLRRRFNAGPFLRLLPGFVLVALVCVVISRLIGLQPGLLLGPLATVGLRQQLPQEKQGQALAVAYASVAVFGVLAWFSRSSVLEAFDPATLPGEVVGVTLTTLVVACTETVAFNMIPLRFLDGSQVIAWSKAAWAGLALFGLYGFIHVLINPDSGGAFTGRTTFLGILLVIYLVLAAAFWAFFHFRAAADMPPSDVPPGDASPPDPSSPGPPPGPPSHLTPSPTVPTPQAEDSMQAAWRAMQGSGWPTPTR
ncbi:MAG: FGLLP motif-containing membrane protein [Acidimicrobiales bacterium]